jgi:hypothetical protein
MTRTWRLIFGGALVGYAVASYARLEQLVVMVWWNGSDDVEPRR